MTTTKTRLGALLATTAIALLGLAGASPASAAPAWSIFTSSNTTGQPGEQITYYLSAGTRGGATDGSEIDLTVDLPPQMSVVSADLVSNVVPIPLDCSSLEAGTSNPFTCKTSATIPPGGEVAIAIVADVSPLASGNPTVAYEVKGGGAPTPVTTFDSTRIAPSPPGFGVDSFDSQVTADAAGDPFTQAGGHPYVVKTQILFNSATDPEEGDVWSPEPPKDILADLPPGLIGNPTSLARCTAEQLEGVSGNPICPSSSQVGTIEVGFNGRPVADDGKAVFNMEPPTGVSARFGFSIFGTRILLDATLRSDGDYRLTVGSQNTPEPFGVVGSEITFWGDPSNPSHDPDRWCPETGTLGSGCTAAPAPPLLRNPTACPPAGEGIPWGLRVSSWDHPDHYETDSFVSHDAPGFPLAREDWGNPQGPTDCDVVPVEGTLDAQPTSPNTETSSGLDVHVEVPNPGLENAKGISSSDIKAVKVELPEGMTINPSQAEGLGACAPGQYASTELSFFPTPGKGCPDDAKIGTVAVKTPLLEETISGDVFIAAPFNNHFGSLLALYIVLHEPQRGILIKLAGKVETNERTGQIITTFDDIPQLPFSSFDFHFRQGSRAPLVTPPACGTYTTKATFTGWSDPEHPITDTSDFQIVHGIGGGPCPSGGLPPFHPGLEAGSENDSAGIFTPFYVGLSRSDGEQEFTNFSIKLPPGVSGKLAGIPFCPDASISAAKGKSGSEELANPSCPKASEVGRTLVGAGVGSVLTYVPGKVYLAGPYNGSALSVAAITSAKVGPFDVGTVVIREALKVNPETAEVFIDPTGSDPLPHIIKGITTHLRDIRAYVDRPDFVLNPTSCKRTSTASTVLGSGLDFASSADDNPITVTSPFQAANCLNLAFKPKLSLRLIGPTHRSAHPKLRAELRMPQGNANISRAAVTLPKTEFLENAHIKTICTRVQYAAGVGGGKSCPPGSVYGYAKAWTPLLDKPLEGPVYLRSSSHRLPDLVASLDGQIHIDVVGRIDSVNARIRSSFETVPDAPVSKFVLTMQGGKKGLLVNSSELCKRPVRADALFDAHNGKSLELHPLVRVGCGKGKGRK